MTPKQAVQLQNELRDKVKIVPLPPVTLVAGVDCAFRDGRIYAMAVVWDIGQRAVVETKALSQPLRFPYVPGLLSFREVPALTPLLARLRTPFDAVLCDGQGLAHPRRIGLASHLGLLLDRPTVGCAKSRLLGDHVEPGVHRGEFSELRHQGERVGTVLRTRTRVKPLFISPGHRCDHRGAIELVLRCGGGYRLPEPTRLADQGVAAFKRGHLARFRAGLRSTASQVATHKV